MLQHCDVNGQNSFAKEVHDEKEHIMASSVGNDLPPKPVQISS
jgi:hypothetical protein